MYETKFAATRSVRAHASHRAPCALDRHVCAREVAVLVALDAPRDRAGHAPRGRRTVTTSPRTPGASSSPFRVLERSRVEVGRRPAAQFLGSRELGRDPRLGEVGLRPLVPNPNEGRCDSYPGSSRTKPGREALGGDRRGPTKSPPGALPPIAGEPWPPEHRPRQVHGEAHRSEIAYGLSAVARAGLVAERLARARNWAAYRKARRARRSVRPVSTPGIRRGGARSPRSPTNVQLFAKSSVARRRR